MLGCRASQMASENPAPVANPAPFQILNAWVDGDSLRSVVQHSGGCDAHTFSLRHHFPHAEKPPTQATCRLGTSFQ